MFLGSWFVFFLLIVVKVDEVTCERYLFCNSLVGGGVEVNCVVGGEVFEVADCFEVV